jgi:hypothetical protein
MSSQTNKDLWQRWNALWNGHLALDGSFLASHQRGLDLECALGCMLV